jgi:hypothetical protein
MAVSLALHGLVRCACSRDPDRQRKCVAEQYKDGDKDRDQQAQRSERRPIRRDHAINQNDERRADRDHQPDCRDHQRGGNDLEDQISAARYGVCQGEQPLPLRLAVVEAGPNPSPGADRCHVAPPEGESARVRVSAAPVTAAAARRRD